MPMGKKANQSLYDAEAAPAPASQRVDGGELVSRVLESQHVKYLFEVDLRQAFREATTPPQGPTLVEIPTNVLYDTREASEQRRGAKVYAPDDLRSAADPAKIERVIELLESAERPLIAAGDGIFWSG